jgi:uroporphyrinogen-III decarboxylase
MLTNKENYLRLLRGEIPESIPKFNMFTMVGPGILEKDRGPNKEGFDFFGVEYVFVPEAGGSIPVPNKFMFTDVTKWRDHFHTPDLSAVDWEKMAKEDLKKQPDPDQPIVGSFITGFFQTFINYMGFTEGLCAVIEEPDAVRELVEAVTDFYIEVGKKMIQYYKPDAMWLPDDIATARAPFVSLDAFRELFAPSWKRFVDLFLNEGIPTQLHCCGQCMPLIDDWVDMRIAAWDPVQISNDIAAVQAKHGRKLAIVGGYDMITIAGSEGDTEEDIRANARLTIDKYAKNGGFGIFGGSPPPVSPDTAPPPPPTSEVSAGTYMKRIGWATDEMSKYSEGYYNR